MRMAIHPIGSIFYGYVANKQGGYFYAPFGLERDHGKAFTEKLR